LLSLVSSNVFCWQVWYTTLQLWPTSFFLISKAYVWLLFKYIQKIDNFKICALCRVKIHLYNLISVVFYVP
jgi:hypothetical protein